MGTDGCDVWKHGNRCNVMSVGHSLGLHLYFRTPHPPVCHQAGDSTDGHWQLEWLLCVKLNTHVSWVLLRTTVHAVTTPASEPRSARCLEIPRKRKSVPKPQGPTVAAGEQDRGPGPCTCPTPHAQSPSPSMHRAGTSALGTPTLHRALFSSDSQKSSRRGPARVPMDHVTDWEGGA